MFRQEIGGFMKDAGLAGSDTSPRLRILLDGAIPSMLWHLAAPNVLAVAVMSLATFADALFVGSLGTAALASLALVFPFQTFMQMAAGGAIGGGTTSSVARALGGGSTEKAEAAIWHAIAIAVAMALVFAIVLGLFSRPIFSILGGKGEALEGAVRYARIAFGGGVAIWLLFVLSAVLRGTGDTVTPARAMIVCAVCQIGLSGALTLGWGPFPALGIAGPATALIVCQGTGAAYLAIYLIRGKAGVRLRPGALRLAPLADILKVGGIGLINSLSIVATVVVITGIIGQYGTPALAGYGLGGRLELMIVPIAFGMGGALTAAVGVNFGAGQYARARRVAWVGAGVTFVVSGLIGGGVAIWPSLWLDHFTGDQAAYGYGLSYLVIVAPFYCLFGAGQTLYFASQGTGRMLLPVCVGVVRFAFVSAIGLAAVIFAWPLEVVFGGVAAGLCVIGLGLVMCLYSKAWRPDVG